MQTAAAGDVEFYGELRSETEKAYCFFDGCEEIWLPKSQVKKLKFFKGNDYEVTVSEWIAKKKGII